ncbi:MAG: carboxypeptidase-like regulatory domain-containing protein [Bacillota bacterium]
MWRVYGRVIGADNRGISGAEVCLLSETERRVAQTTTDESGRFRLTTSGSGSFRLLAGAACWAQAQQGLCLFDDGVEARIVLGQRPGQLVAEVVDPVGRPLAGARLIVRDRAGLVWADQLADGQGRFVFSGLPSDHYCLVAIASGHGTAWTGATVGPDEPCKVVIQVPPGAARLTGIVSGGGRARRAVVRLFAPGGTLLLTAVSDATGSFSFHDLPKAVYTLLIAAPDHGIVGYQAGALTADDRPQLYPLASEGSVVTGVVLDPGGQPAGGAALVLRAGWWPGCPGWPTISDSLGRFELPAVPPGEYLLWAFPHGQAPGVIGFTAPGDGRFQAALRLPRTAAATTRGVVTGHLPTQGVEVSLLSGDGDLVTTVLADPAGQLALEGLAPGDHQVLARSLSGGRGRAAFTGVPGSPDQFCLELVAQEAAVEGQVRRGFEQPGGYPVVFYHGGNRAVAGCFTAPDGHFLLERLPPGGGALRSGQLGRGRALLGVVLEAESTPRVELAGDRASGSIVGCVEAPETGSPLAGAAVWLYEHDLYAVDFVRTSHQGEFAFSGLRSGYYGVFVRVSGRTSVWRSLHLSVGEEATLRLRLPVGDDPVPSQAIPAEASPERPGRICGRIRDTGSGVGLAGALVHLESPEGNAWAQAVTDRAGDYVLEGIPPGVHALVARAPGYLARFRQVEVEPDQTALGSLELNPKGGRIWLAVRGERCQALGGAQVTVVQGGTYLPITLGRTGPGGEYTRSGLAPGLYHLVVRFTGYAAGYLAVRIIPDHWSCETIQLSRRPRSPMLPEGRWTGRSLTAENLAGYLDPQVPTALPGPEPSSLDLLLRYGTEPGNGPMADVPHSGRTVGSGTLWSGVNPHHRLSGRVRLAGAEHRRALRLVLTNPEGFRRVTRVRRRGHFAVDDLPPGRYELGVELKGYHRQALVVEIPGGRRWIRISLRPQQDTGAKAGK